MHGFGSEQAEHAITTVRLFLHQTPVSVLQGRIGGNSIKYVVRLIVSALF
jgi:hypothetical protein